MQLWFDSVVCGASFTESSHDNVSWKKTEESVSLLDLEASSKAQTAQWVLQSVESKFKGLTLIIKSSSL